MDEDVRGGAGPAATTIDYTARAAERVRKERGPLAWYWGVLLLGSAGRVTSRWASEGFDAAIDSLFELGLFLILCGIATFAYWYARR